MPRNLVFAPGVWSGLLAGLAARGQGRRESGAFLLGQIDGDTARVTSVAFYDDLDPNCLTGAISFASEAYGRLWDLCAAREAQVVADTHTHPGGWVEQSATDRAHPMISMAGHVALILPNFAQGQLGARDIGVHDYLGNGSWESSLGPDVDGRLVIETSRLRRWWQFWRR